MHWTIGENSRVENVVYQRALGGDIIAAIFYLNRGLPTGMGGGQAVAQNHFVIRHYWDKRLQRTRR